MDQKTAELLSELKYAIDQALWNSELIRATITALEHAGQDVRIEIDAALVHHRAPATCSAVVTHDQPDSDGHLRLNATDMLFLQALKISLERA